MKKIVSFSLAFLLLLNTLAVLAFVNVFAEDSVILSKSTINTYDDETLQFNVTGMGNTTFNHKTNNPSSKPQIASNIKVLPGVGVDGSYGVSVNSITAEGRVGVWPTAIKIYDAGACKTKWTYFDPEANSSYKIKFQYKLKDDVAQDINIGVRGYSKYNTDFNGVNSVALETLLTIKSGTSATGDNWVTYEGKIDIAATDYGALSLSATVKGTTDYKYSGLFFDNISVEKVMNYNTYDDETLQFNVTGMGNTTFNHKTNNPSSKPQIATYMKVQPGIGVDGTYGVSVNTITAEGRVGVWPTAIKLYDSDLCKEKWAFVDPLPNASYKVTFNYKLKDDVTQDFNIGIRGYSKYNTDFNGVNSDAIGTVLTIKSGTKATGENWVTGEGIITLGNTDYEALSLSVTVKGSTDYKYTGLVFDNINLEKVSVEKSNKTQNSYDDPVVVYKVTGLGNTVVHPTKDTQNYKFQISCDMKVLPGIGVNGSYGVNANKITGESRPGVWPTAIKLYDSENYSRDCKKFDPDANIIYKITFKYKLAEAITQDINIGVRGYKKAGTDFNGVNSTALGTIYTIKSGTQATGDNWVTGEGTIAIDDTDYAEIAISATVTGNVDYKYSGLFLDDINLEKNGGTRFINYETNGGTKLAPTPFLSGQMDSKLPALSIPKKDGYIFCGWYTDSTLKNEFTLDSVPDTDVTIYAKWEKNITEPASFSTGFEASDYQNGVVPYSNIGEGTHVTGNHQTSKTVWHNNDEENANTGNGYLSLANTQRSAISAKDLSFAALINPDGSNYQVLKGKRYHVSFSNFSDGSINIVFVTAEQVPTGRIVQTNFSVLTDIYYHTDTAFGRETWGQKEDYFVSNSSGKVYVLAYGPTGNYVRIDDLKIEPVDEKVATYANFYQEDNTLLQSDIGKIGSILQTPLPKAKEGYTFDGWKTKEGEQYYDAVYPPKDMNLYATYRPVEDLSNATTDFSSKKVIDFETDPAKESAFYASGEYSTTPKSGTYLITNDPAGAHSGSTYYRFYNAGNWDAKNYPRMKFYDPNSTGNMIYLEPRSIYKVSFWLKVERSALLRASIRVASLGINDKDIISMTHVAAIDENEFGSKYDQWIKYEGMVYTDSEKSTLGIAVSAGYLTASLDDITVEKLNKIRIDFDSNGGSEVPPNVDKLITYDNAIEPEAPTKEGFTFAGWYLDKQLTKPFNFKKTAVTENITLYAAWDPIEEQQYETKTTYTYEDETVELETPEEYDKEQVNLISINKGKKALIDKKDKEITDKSESTSNSFNWTMIIVIFASAVVLVGGVATGIIVSKKRRKNV